MLIVVENRDGHLAYQLFLDVKTVRCFDVFQIDPPECGLQQSDGPDELVRVTGIDLDIEYVQVGEALEENGLPFHHRLRCQRADVPESQHRGPVRHHPDQTAAGSIFKRKVWIFLDSQGRNRNPRRVRQAEVGLRHTRLERNHLDFSGPGFAVVTNGLLFIQHYACSPCVFGCCVFSINMVSWRISDRSSRRSGR